MLFILWNFGTVCGHLVHFFNFGTLYQKNLTTMEPSHRMLAKVFELNILATF
jgi:hypothetical protein